MSGDDPNYEYNLALMWGWMTQCRGITRTGERCKRHVLDCDRYDRLCQFHRKQAPYIDALWAKRERKHKDGDHDQPGDEQP